MLANKILFNADRMLLSAACSPNFNGRNLPTLGAFVGCYPEPPPDPPDALEPVVALFSATAASAFAIAWLTAVCTFIDMAVLSACAVPPAEAQLHIKLDHHSPRWTEHAAGIAASLEHAPHEQ